MNGGWGAGITGCCPCRARNGPARTSGAHDPACTPNRDSATSCNSSGSPARSSARGARVIAACPEPLVRLVARCPGVDAVQDWYAPIPECDVHAPLMSLPAILGTTLATLPGECPYLSADAATVDRLAADRRAEPGVGLSARR